MNGFWLIYCISFKIVFFNNVGFYVAQFVSFFISFELTILRVFQKEYWIFKVVLLKDRSIWLNKSNFKIKENK